MKPWLSGAVALVAGFVLVALPAATPAQQAATPAPRAGLTARETQNAVKFARQAMVELRKKTTGALQPQADQREYVVSVELQAAKTDAADQAPAATPDQPAEPQPPKDQPAPARSSHRAVVTSYRYFDDLTVFTTVDLATGKIVDVQAVQHLRTPLSDAEFAEAQVLARQTDEVKKLYETFGDRLSVYPQFSQFTLGDDPRIHRVVHLSYRVGKRELSHPRPQVDLTTRSVVIPQHEPGPPARPPRNR